MIKIRELQKSFNSHLLIDNLSLDIAGQKFTVLFGPNGTGKSSLLKIIAGIDRDYSGELLGVQGKKISFVFQDYRKSLLPWLNVKENIYYPLKLNKISREVFERRLQYYLEITAFKLDLRKNVFELSGGEAQMTAILRALITEPDVLLMDEPFSALDYERCLLMRESLRSIAVRLKLTVLMVSHDLDEAIFMADEILFLSKETKSCRLVEIKYPVARTSDLLTSDYFQERKKLCLDIIRNQIALLPENQNHKRVGSDDFGY